MPSGIYERKYRPVFDRLMEKVEIDQDTGCWLWTGTVSSDGYGAIRGRAGKMMKVHRVSYEHHFGAIPDGMEIDHTCRIRHCVNREHLEAVTHKENCQRASALGTYGGAKRQKTHCPQGHPYSGHNLYVSPAGVRQCRICRRKYVAAAIKRRRARS